jgi:hypothetical protein
MTLNPLYFFCIGTLKVDLHRNIPRALDFDQTTSDMDLQVCFHDAASLRFQIPSSLLYLWYGHLLLEGVSRRERTRIAGTVATRCRCEHLIRFNHRLWLSGKYS